MGQRLPTLAHDSVSVFCLVVSTRLQTAAENVYPPASINPFTAEVLRLGNKRA